VRDSCGAFLFCENVKNGLTSATTTFTKDPSKVKRNRLVDSLVSVTSQHSTRLVVSSLSLAMKSQVAREEDFAEQPHLHAINIHAVLIIRFSDDLHSYWLRVTLLVVACCCWWKKHFQFVQKSIDDDLQK